MDTKMIIFEVEEGTREKIPSKTTAGLRDQIDASILVPVIQNPSFSWL
jgi:hypothetical protein